MESQPILWFISIASFLIVPWLLLSRLINTNKRLVISAEQARRNQEQSKEINIQRLDSHADDSFNLLMARIARESNREQTSLQIHQGPYVSNNYPGIYINTLLYKNIKHNSNNILQKLEDLGYTIKNSDKLHTKHFYIISWD